MAATSFTSSSNHDRAGNADAPHQHPPLRAGVPWAFLIAIALVGALEIFLHTRPRESLIAYNSDIGLYAAAHEYIAFRGPADVALVGSSQTREGVVMPRLIDAVRGRLNRPVSIANYGSRGARVDGFEAIIDDLLRQPKKPQLIVLGISVRDLRAQEPDLPRMSMFFNWRDWSDEFRRSGWRATDALPQVVRNTIFKELFTLRYRERISNTLNAKVLSTLGQRSDQFDDEPNPILGQGTAQHAGSHGTTSLADSKRALRKIFNAGRLTYDWNSPTKPPAAMRKRLHAIAEKCDRAGVRLVVIEMPLSPLWLGELNRAGMVKAFEESVKTALADTKADYWPYERQPLKFTDADFSDLQHHNLQGAEKFSDWLAGVIAKTSE